MQRDVDRRLKLCESDEHLFVKELKNILKEFVVRCVPNSIFQAAHCPVEDDEHHGTGFLSPLRMFTIISSET